MVMSSCELFYRIAIVLYVDMGRWVRSMLAFVLKFRNERWCARGNFPQYFNVVRALFCDFLSGAMATNNPLTWLIRGRVVCNLSLLIVR